MVLVVKNPPANAGDKKDVGLIPGWGRAPEGEHGSPLQYSCLENPMDRGPWQATLHRVAQSWTELKRLSMHAHNVLITVLDSIHSSFGCFINFLKNFGLRKFQLLAKVTQSLF